MLLVLLVLFLYAIMYHYHDEQVYGSVDLLSRGGGGVGCVRTDALLNAVWCVGCGGGVLTWLACSSACDLQDEVGMV